MPWRCINNLSADCIPEPEWDIQPVPVTVTGKDGVVDTNYINGTCNRDWHTCDRYKVIKTEHVGHGVTFKVTPPNADGSIAKLSKKQRKEEAEKVQGTLF